MAPLVTFVQEGESVDYKPPANLAAGDVVVQADLVGVATRPIVAAELGALAVAGVFDFPKTGGSGGSEIPAGTLLYWDVSEQVVSTSSGAGKLIGKSILLAEADATTVRVRLSQ
jgi:predicted RecA/RadA family phage recombinase